MTGASLAGPYTQVAVHVVNGGVNDIELNPSDDLVLQDDSGHALHLIPAPTDARFAVPAGTVTDATLIFRGSPGKKTKRLSLVTCSDFGGSSEYTRNPKLTVSFAPASRS